MARPRWWPATYPKISNLKGRRSKKRARQVFLGPEIVLSGELTSCDKVVAEGTIESKRIECREFILGHAGSFKGAVQAENAEITGCFEGRLVVRARLLIKSGGQVKGSVQYGQIEIEPGGELQGDMVLKPASEQPADDELDILDITVGPKSGRLTVNSISSACTEPLAVQTGGHNQAIEVAPARREVARQ